MRKSSIDSELKREFVVGSFTFVVMLGLFSFSVFISGEVFLRPEQILRISFEDVMGLEVGESVVARGMPVGEVKRLVLLPDKNRVMVTCYLQERVALKTDYKATIVPSSMLGGQHLRIYEGTNSVVLPEDVQLFGSFPHDVLSDVGAIVSEVRSTLENQGGLEDLRVALKQTREIVEKINSGKGTLGKMLNDKALYDDIKMLAANLKAVSKELHEGKGLLAKLIHDEAMYADMKSTVANLKAVTKELNEGKGMLTRLLYDETMYADIKATVTNLNVVSQRLVDGKGLLGRMLAEDDAIYEEARLLLQDVRAAVDDFRETAPILTFTSVFFGVF